MTTDRILCAHADQHGEGAHWLAPGEVCADVEHYRQVAAVLDTGAVDLVRLVLGLAAELDVYDPDAGEFDENRPMYRDLDGGAGLVPLHLDEVDLATLREVLDCAADVRRGADAP
jgi:hypothetical protein